MLIKVSFARPTSADFTRSKRLSRTSHSPYYRSIGQEMESMTNAREGGDGSNAGGGESMRQGDDGGGGSAEGDGGGGIYSDGSHHEEGSCMQRYMALTILHSLCCTHHTLHSPYCTHYAVLTILHSLCCTHHAALTVGTWHSMHCTLYTVPYTHTVMLQVHGTLRARASRHYPYHVRNTTRVHSATISAL
jgi:hypothetical protein